MSSSLVQFSIFIFFFSSFQSRMYKMQLQDSMKQFYKTVKKDDMRNFSFVHWE